MSKLPGCGNNEDDITVYHSQDGILRQDECTEAVQSLSMLA